MTDLYLKILDYTMKGRGKMTGKVKARICFASLICVLALLLTSCDFRLMSRREVEVHFVCI